LAHSLDQTREFLVLREQRSHEADPAIAIR
jgi:hypothetical protein